MFRRVSALAIVAFAAAAFAMPGTAAAADPFRVAVKVDHCQFSGGAHNRGYVELKVRSTELGRSGTNYFLVLGAYQESSGLGFSTQSNFPPDKSTVFPDNGTTHFHVTDERHDFTRNDELVARIQMTVRFKNNAGKTVATRTVTGSPCG